MLCKYVPQRKKNIGQYIGILNLQINKIPYLVGFNIFCKVLNHLVSVVSASICMVFLKANTIWTGHTYTSYVYHHDIV